MAIDLSKLKALELPTKEVTLTIAGQEQSILLQALDDEVSVQIAVLADQKNNADAFLKIHQLVIKNGVCGITDEEVELLCKMAMSDASKLTEEIKNLTVEFAKKREQIAADAKKNSKSEPVVTI